MQPSVAIPLMVVFVALGLWLLMYISSKMPDEGGPSILLSSLPGDQACDYKALLYEGKGAVAMNTSRRTMAVITPDRTLHTFHADKIIEARVETDVRTTYTTRGRAGGVEMGGVLLGTNRSHATERSRVTGAYLVMGMNDFDYPTLVLRFSTPSRS